MKMQRSFEVMLLEVLSRARASGAMLWRRSFLVDGWDGALYQAV